MNKNIKITPEVLETLADGVHYKIKNNPELRCLSTKQHQIKNQSSQVKTNYADAVEITRNI